MSAREFRIEETKYYYLYHAVLLFWKKNENFREMKMQLITMILILLVRLVSVIFSKSSACW